MKNSIFNKYYFIPFAERSNTFDGCDCYGFVQLWYKKELGIELKQYCFCPREISDDFMKKEAQSVFTTETDFKDHDALILKDPWDKPKHAGIFYGGYIAHMSRSRGLLVEKLFDARNKVISIHRYKA